MFVLVDCNNFFASCERVFEPALRTRPLLILSNNDGCVIARSNEVKSLGIKMGDPYFKIRPFCVKNNVVVRSANYALYSDLSGRVMQVLASLSAELEIYSIDEAFIRFPDGLSREELRLRGEAVREKVARWTGLPVSVGIAPSRTLAKLANDFAKSKRLGVATFFAEDAVSFGSFPVSEVWGIGTRTAEALHRLGLRTIGSLFSHDDVFFQSHFSVSLARTVRELRGEPCIAFADDAPKSMAYSRMFGCPVETEAALSESLVSYTCVLAEKLRAEHMTAQGVTLFVQPCFGATFENSQSNLRALPVIFETQLNQTQPILEAIRPYLAGMFVPGERYRKSGCSAFGLVPEAKVESDFFASEKTGKQSRLDRVVDALNRKMGKQTLYPLSRGLHHNWATRRDFLSKAYTTDWAELPVAR